MSEIKFYRKNHVIRDTDNNVVFTGTYRAKFKGIVQDIASINAAKRQSRKLQSVHGAGCLRVIK